MVPKDSRLQLTEFRSNPTSLPHRPGGGGRYTPPCRQMEQSEDTSSRSPDLQVRLKLKSVDETGLEKWR